MISVSPHAVYDLRLCRLALLRLNLVRLCIVVTEVLRLGYPHRGERSDGARTRLGLCSLTSSVSVCTRREDSTLDFVSLVLSLVQLDDRRARRGVPPSEMVVACLAMTMVMRSGGEGKEGHAATYNIVSIIVGKPLSLLSTIHLSFIR